MWRRQKRGEMWFLVTGFQIFIINDNWILSYLHLAAKMLSYAINKSHADAQNRQISSHKTFK